MKFIIKETKPARPSDYHSESIGASNRMNVIENKSEDSNIGRPLL